MSAPTIFQVTVTRVENGYAIHEDRESMFPGRSWVAISDDDLCRRVLPEILKIGQKDEAS